MLNASQDTNFDTGGQWNEISNQFRKFHCDVSFTWKLFCSVQTDEFHKVEKNHRSTINKIYNYEYTINQSNDTPVFVFGFISCRFSKCSIAQCFGSKIICGEFFKTKALSLHLESHSATGIEAVLSVGKPQTPVFVFQHEQSGFVVLGQSTRDFRFWDIPIKPILIQLKFLKACNNCSDFYENANPDSIQYSTKRNKRSCGSLLMKPE